MDLYDRINCIIGDSFFFKIIEKEIEENIKNKYKINSINKEFILEHDNVDKINSSLLPSLFDIEPKIVILRNMKNKLLLQAINNIRSTTNVFIIIEIEKDQYDKRMKIFKELENRNCLCNLGFAYYKNNDKVLDLAFNRIESELECKINRDVRKYLSEYVPKSEFNNKPIHNLNRIFNELKKCCYINKDININICNELIAYPQKYYNIFDITNFLASKNLEKSLDIIDIYATDINEAKNIILFILSELKIICNIADIKNLEFDILYSRLNDINNSFEMMDDIENNREFKKIHPYRLKKILEKSNSDFFNNCFDYFDICLEAYNNLNYNQNNYKIVLSKICLELCS